MINILVKTTMWAAVLSPLLALSAGGCSDDAEAFSLDRAIKDALGVDQKMPVERAMEVFDQEDPDVRRRAVEKLMHNSWALREPYLKRFAQLTDPDVEKAAVVRAVAVRALGASGSRKYEREIVAALRDPSSIVRWDAANVLENMPTDRAVEPLRSLAINDTSADVRAAAAGSLRHYRTDPVFRTLLRCLEDPDLNVRNEARASLVSQTGQDLGTDPRSWSSGEVGAETLPEPTVRYRKRPWWDLMGVSGGTEKIDKTGDDEGDGDRPWWDWFGTTGG